IQHVKTCKRCGQAKELDQFYANPSGRDGKRPECKQCTATRRREWYEANREREIARVREWQVANPDRVRENLPRLPAAGHRTLSNRKSHLKRKYGMPVEEFDEMLARQGGGCAICGRPDADNVDHDHATGRVRGILCFNCNIAVGQMEDDEERFAAAIVYLTRD